MQKQHITKNFFVTGTDTGIGKTYATCNLLLNLQSQGKSAIGIKPLLTGNQELYTDTLALMQHNSMPLPQEIITPFSYREPTSPHIAAKLEGKSPTVTEIMQACQPAFNLPVDVVLVEGVGGWQVPLNNQESLADLAVAFGFPVILVVGIRLGCINHALLTAAAIAATGLQLVGWIANQIDPEFSFIPDYLATIKSRIPAPLLAYLPHRTQTAKIQWLTDFELYL